MCPIWIERVPEGRLRKFVDAALKVCISGLRGWSGARRPAARNAAFFLSRKAGGGCSVPDGPATEPSEAGILRKVSLRLLPFLFLLYVVNILDRTNIGFARLQMLDRFAHRRRRNTPSGAGLFYVGYILFEVPSNLILRRTGARVWIARILVSWGARSPSCMMFVTGPWGFYLAARAAGRRRGRLLSRNHPLPQLLVPGPRTGPGGGPVHGRRPGRRRSSATRCRGRSFST